jgi:RNA polymerase sigma-70 factor (ECF subfamily)
MKWLLPVVDGALRRVLTLRDLEYEDVRHSSVEAVLAALQKNEFRGDSSLSTWASRIVRNVAIDALRARSRERRMFAHEEDSEEEAPSSQSLGASPEKRADAREQLTRYCDALWTLCASKAQVVYLHDVLGHRIDEIAAKLGISASATQSRLVRGRRELLRARPLGNGADDRLERDRGALRASELVVSPDRV